MSNNVKINIMGWGIYLVFLATYFIGLYYPNDFILAIMDFMVALDVIITLITSLFMILIVIILRSHSETLMAKIKESGASEQVINDMNRTLHGQGIKPMVGLSFALAAWSNTYVYLLGYHIPAIFMMTLVVGSLAVKAYFPCKQRSSSIH